MTKWFIALLLVWASVARADTTTFNSVNGSDLAQCESTRNLGNGWPPPFQDCYDNSLFYIAKDRLAATRYYVEMALIRWDTSTLAGTTVSSASVDICVDSGTIFNDDTRSFDCEWYPNWVTPSVADYTTGSASTALSVAISSLSDVTSPCTVNTLTLTNAPVNIQTSGFTALRCTISGSTPNGFNEFQFSGGDDLATAPKLSVVFTPAETPTGTLPATATITPTPSPTFTRTITNTATITPTITPTPTCPGEPIVPQLIGELAHFGATGPLVTYTLTSGIPQYDAVFVDLTTGPVCSPDGSGNCVDLFADVTDTQGNTYALGAFTGGPSGYGLGVPFYGPQLHVSPNSHPLSPGDQIFISLPSSDAVAVAIYQVRGVATGCSFRLDSSGVGDGPGPCVGVFHAPCTSLAPVNYSNEFAWNAVATNGAGGGFTPAGGTVLNDFTATGHRLITMYHLVNPTTEENGGDFAERLFPEHGSLTGFGGANFVPGCGHECIAPTHVPTNTPTSTPTGPSPTPTATVTGTPPTNTPTVTGTVTPTSTFTVTPPSVPTQTSIAQLTQTAGPPATATRAAQETQTASIPTPTVPPQGCCQCPFICSMPLTQHDCEMQGCTWGGPGTLCVLVQG